MPSMIEARTKIAKEYCRHVVVIDDQCQPEAENHERYGLFATECEAAGIACNIFGYFGRRTFASAEDIVASHELALRSDVVVLDWHLGEDRGESAAIELLAALKNDRGVHIVFIDTRHAQQDVADALEAELGLTRFDGEPGDGPDDPNEIEEVSLDEGGDSPLLKSDDGGLVVAVRTHDGDRDAASGVLLDQVRDLLRRAFQTHLHWAGLEFVSRSRELMPQVLRSLPNDSDPCIIHQLLHSHSDQVISAQVAEVFGDEIQRFLEARPLESVSGAVLIDDLNTRMSAYCAKESAFMDLSKDGCPGFATVIESIRNKQAAQPPNGLTKQETADLESLDKARNLWNGTPSYEDIASAYAPCISNKGERCPYFPYKGKAGAHLASAQLISRVTESAAPDFRPWAALRETCLLTPTNYPLPGMLLVKKTGHDANKAWLVCVSGACDCYWGKGELLFLKGVSTSDREPHRSREAELQTCYRNVHIVWQLGGGIVFSSNSMQRDDDGTIVLRQRNTRYQLTGQLRRDFFSRLVQRLWAHLSRVGVDTAEYIRLCRGEFK